MVEHQAIRAHRVTEVIRLVTIGRELDELEIVRRSQHEMRLRPATRVFEQLPQHRLAGQLVEEEQVSQCRSTGSGPASHQMS